MQPDALPLETHPALVAYENAPKDDASGTPEEIVYRLENRGESIPHALVGARFGLLSEEAPIAWDPRAVEDVGELGAEHAPRMVGEVGRFASFGIGELRRVSARRQGPRRAPSAFTLLARVAERVARNGGELERPIPGERPRVLVLPGFRVFLHFGGSRLSVVGIFR